MNWRHLAALLAATSTFASASAEVRIIVEPHDPSPNANIGKLADHDNDTPFVSPGGTVDIQRSSDTFLWVYEHGINLLPTQFSDDDANVTGSEFTSSDGRVSRVILPLFQVGGQQTLTQAGTKAFKVNVKRDAQVGDTVNFTISKSNGAIRFKGRITCSNITESQSALTTLTASAEAIGAGGQGSFTFKFDKPLPCQSQQVQISLPACFESAVPGSPTRGRFFSPFLRPSDPKQMTLPIFAAAPGTCTNGGGDIKVTSNGVTKTVAVRFFDSSTLSKPKPLVPQIPDMLKPEPINPNAPVTPKPKGPGGG
jgi:hypothetical protein